MRFEQWLKTFKTILQAYPQDKPLSKFLPEYYRKNRQMGSSDRRMATRLLYNYFRLGAAAANKAEEERLHLAEFLCTPAGAENAWLAYFRPDLNSKPDMPLAEKIDWLAAHEDFLAENVFPFSGHLSPQVDSQAFIRSLFIQPDLFIRMYPGRETEIKNSLLQAGINFTQPGEHALALPNGAKLEEVFTGRRPFEVQDWSSQRTGHFFKPQKFDKWWDACAASGGKSLLLHSLEPEIKLLVSDIRASVLQNLDERFQNAGLKNYQKKNVDLMGNVDQELHHYEFDGIILDAPCTGSGTWGRTPEMISQFNESKISGFNKLQKTIASNVIKYLKPGKPLVYITCSVFKQENEDIVNYLIEQGLTPESSGIIPGYADKADTLFAARLIK